MNNWKTTAAGVLTIVGGICKAGLDLSNGHPLDFPTLIAAFTAGIGLIHAADAKKS